MVDIKGYEGKYAITSCGKVWSYEYENFLSQHKDHKGYLRVDLCKDGVKKNFKVHRLVADAYIPNPNGYETVDHIDSCKTHNWVNNLQWMSRENNIKKARNKQVLCVELNKTFISAKEASIALKVCYSSITGVCRGERRTAGGYHFKFI